MSFLFLNKDIGKMKKTLSKWPLIVLALLLLTIFGIILKQLSIKFDSQNRFVTKKSVAIDKNKGFYLDFALPKGFKMKQGGRSWLWNVVDRENQIIVSIGLVGGGELSPAGTIFIDDIPFTMEREDSIKCRVGLTPGYIPGVNGYIKVDDLNGGFFYIDTFCSKNEQESTKAVKEIINSIHFSQPFKDYYLGTKENPLPTLRE